MQNDMLGLLTDSAASSAFELTLSKQLADTLHKHYPGHLWGVHVNVNTGMVDILNFALSGKWGYRLKLADHVTSSEWDREAMRAGGEILERYDQARARANVPALTHLPVDFAGQHKPTLD